MRAGPRQGQRPWRRRWARTLAQAARAPPCRPAPRPCLHNRIEPASHHLSANHLARTARGLPSTSGGARQNRASLPTAQGYRATLRNLRVARILFHL
ncbi:hypothetical protein BN2497_13011 [Janthinobacterium sp. CG23_2]|nr:hypothetical protein BN2497_13011 [Janthinobacterium sp. CG23_2]CUU32903.1 hypothetical protein BN3177_13011 [Janthinobacterium sp. CG23_2]